MTNRRKKYLTSRFLCFLLACFILTSIMVTAASAAGADSVSILVRQKFTCYIDEPSLNRTFNYCLSPITEGAPMPSTAVDGEYRFSMTGDETFSIDPISFSIVGDYHYLLRQEVDEKIDGYVYDEREYEVIVLVEHAGDGVRARVTLPLNESGYKESEILFVNSFGKEGYDPVTDDPPIEKLVKGEPSQDEEFSFMFKAASEDCPMPDGSDGFAKKLTVLGQGSVEAGLIEFTRPGVYRYSLAEENTGIPGYTYDTTVYSITYTVVSQKGVLSISDRSITANGAKVSKAVFTNTYTEPKPSEAPTSDTTSATVSPTTPVVASPTVSGAQSPTVSGTTSGKAGTPKTSDTVDVIVLVSVMIASMLVLLFILLFYKKKDDDDKDKKDDSVIWSDSEKGGKS